MKFAIKLAAGCAILVAAPASAQILGGAGGQHGGAGGQLGGQVGGTIGNAGRTVRGTADTATDAEVERDVDRRSGRANARARGNARGDGTLDALGRTANVGGSASGNADAGAQAIGTDKLRDTVGNVRGRTGNAVANTRDRAGNAVANTRGRAGNAVGNARGSGGNASADAGGSGRAGINGTTGHLAAAGSAAASAAGVFPVSPGMIVRDASGRAIGRVQQFRARSNGAIDNVVVRVGDRLANLPDENFSGSGSVLVSAMSQAQVQRMSRSQSGAQPSAGQRSGPREQATSNGRGSRPAEVDKE